MELPLVIGNGRCFDVDGAEGVPNVPGAVKGKVDVGVEIDELPSPLTALLKEVPDNEC
jgi:hypothetical protein